MADSLHVGTVDQRRGSFAAGLNLQNPGGAGYCTGFGTLSVGGVAPALTFAAGQRPRSIGRATSRTDSERTLSGSWRVKGATYADCVVKVEQLVAEVGSGRYGRWLRWRPEGHAAYAYMRILGPGTWTSGYRWAQFNQALGWEFEISWPIEVDGYGLPWDVIDDWNDTAFAEWTKATDPLALTATPGELITGNGLSGTSLFLHTGRNVPPMLLDEVQGVYEHDAGIELQLILNYVDALNYVSARYYNDGAGSGQIECAIIVAGGAVAGGSQALAVPVVGARYGLRLTRASPLNFAASVYEYGKVEPMAVAHHELAAFTEGFVDGTSAEAVFANGGQAGFAVKRQTPGASPGNFKLRHWRRRPLTFRPEPVGTLVPPGARVARLGKLPGAVDGPPVDAEVTLQPARRGNQAAIQFGLLAWGPWHRRNLAHANNLPQHGGWFSAFSVGTNAQGGFTGGGMTGAVPGANINDDHYDYVATAANQGVALEGPGASGMAGIVAGDFKRGRRYTFSVELRAPDAATRNWEVGIGKLPGAAANVDFDATVVADRVTAVASVSPNWARFTVSVVPNRDCFEIQAWIQSTVAGQISVRNAKLYEGASTDYNEVPLIDGHPTMGVLLPANVDDFSGGSQLAANYGGFDFTFDSSSLPRRWGWILSPRPEEFPDFGGPLVIEVYAEISVNSTTVVAPLMKAGIRPADVAGVATRWATPHGSIGKAITKPASGGQKRRTYKLGAVTIEPGDTSRQMLEVYYDDPSIGAGTGNNILHRVILAPVHARAMLPTGRQPDSAYPTLFPALGASPQEELARVVRPDLSSLYEGELNRYRSAAPSLGGEPVRLPAGRDTQLLCWLVQGVPDDPTSDAHAEEELTLGFETHVAVRPRYALAAIANG